MLLRQINQSKFLNILHSKLILKNFQNRRKNTSEKHEGGAQRITLNGNNNKDLGIK